MNRCRGAPSRAELHITLSAVAKAVVHLYEQTNLEYLNEAFISNKVSAYIKHLNPVFKDHEAQCPYAKVQCMHPSCGVLVPRDDLSRHLTEDCIFREQQCQLCGLVTTADKLKVKSLHSVFNNCYSGIDESIHVDFYMIVF